MMDYLLLATIKVHKSLKKKTIQTKIHFFQIKARQNYRLFK